jgi:carbon-monoxide dehydrogenase small subunit
MLAVDAVGHDITTIEGLNAEGGLHPVQKSFVEIGALQCGFCTPGMVLASVDFLQHNPMPTRAEIREALSGNLCRCTGYAKIIEAVEAVAKEHGKALD